MSAPEGEVLSHRYAERLERLQTPLWKRVVDVQAPYRFNLRRLRPGRMLDIGCGIGRNLAHVREPGIGVDPNLACVEQARARGLDARTPEAFLDSSDARDGAFDSLLVAHVLEHLPPEGARPLIAPYLRFLRPGGALILITPQEKGFATDATHLTFLDLEALATLVRDLGLEVERRYSFPFPRAAGKLFPYNEFVVVGRKPA